MPSYIEKAEQISLPVAVLHGTVAFPSVPINFEVLDEISSAGVKAAGSGNAFIFLVSSSDRLSASATPEVSQLYRVGTVAKIKQSVKTAEENAKKSLRRTFILRKIAKAEQIAISQDELNVQLKGLSQYYGYKEKELRSMLEKSGGMDELQLDILNAKVLEFLAKQAEENAAK